MAVWEDQPPPVKKRKTTSDRIPLTIRWDPKVARPLLRWITERTGEKTGELVQRLVYEEALRLRVAEETSSEQA